MEEDTREFATADIYEVNKRNRLNPKCINLKNQIYLGCVKCGMYTWFSQEDKDNPICIYCKE